MFQQDFTLDSSNYVRYRTDEFSAGVLKQAAMWRIWCLGKACPRHRES